MIDIETMKLSRLDTRKNLQTQYLNAVNDLMNNQRNFKNRKTIICLPKKCIRLLPTAIGKESLQ